MKRCNGCERDLPQAEFGKNKSKKDGLQSQCKKCCKDRSATWYKDNKEVQLERNRIFKRKLRLEVSNYLLQHPCPCGESRPECLDFDHVDPATKLDNVANLISQGKSTKVWEEIAKCQVLCANCHRVKTSKQFGWITALDGLVT